MMEGKRGGKEQRVRKMTKGRAMARGVRALLAVGG